MTAVVDKGMVPDWDRAPLRSSDPSVADRTDRPAGLWPRRIWLLALAGAATWALLDAAWAEGSAFNPSGGTILGEFASAAAHPDLSRQFLGAVLPSLGTTLAYAVLGTSLALITGVIGGAVLSNTLWQRDPLDDRPARGGRPALLAWRAGATGARGVHEAVWALVLLSVLGRDPWVAVLAIGIPFGAITAKVVSELIDEAEAASSAVRRLRTTGGRPVPALVYGLGPSLLPDLVSYGSYRFECALRSSVVLGAIGAGGIGFELLQSFQSLRYEEIWTLVYVLCGLAVLVDQGSARLRLRRCRHPGRLGIAAIVALSISAAYAGLRLRSLTGARPRELATELASRAWPPRLPAGGWARLLDAFVDTLQMSMIAIAIAVSLATPLAFLAARVDDGSRASRYAGRAARAGLVLLRSIPPILWAFLVLLVVFPGPLPGGIALGLYTAGVLGRLNAEVVENADPGPARAVRGIGAGAVTAFAYGTVPVVAPRMAALSLYRWEVVVRDTVVVGLVGASGLGRLLAEQSAALDESRMATTILALIAAAFLIDGVSARVRAVLR